MKKLLQTIIILLFAFFVAGCNTGTTNGTSTIPQYVDPEFGVSTKQLIEDIPKNEIIAACLSSKFVEESPVKYVSHEITIRKIDKDARTDLVCCAICVEDDYISAEIEAKLNYSFYDVGGWVLDSVTIEDYCLTPLKAANAELIINESKTLLSTKYDYDSYRQVNLPTSQWYNKFYLFSSLDALGNEEAYELNVYASDFTVISSQLNDARSMTHLNVSLNSGVVHIEGYIPLSFDQKHGWDWSAKQVFKNYKEDWPIIIITRISENNIERALGTYASSFYTFTINKIDITNKTITYTAYGITNTIAFDPIQSTMEIYISGYSFIYPERIEYNPQRENWQERYYSTTNYMWEIITFHKK